MKIYIVSDNRDIGIFVANLLNKIQNMNAIISEANIDGYEELIEESRSNVGKGFDYIIVLSSEPYKASIDVNKANYARAVPCRTRLDIDSACRNAKANVIVLDSTKGRAQLAELIDEFSDVSFENANVGKPIEEEQQYESKIDIVKSVKGILGVGPDRDKITQAPQKRKKAKKEVKVEEEEDEDEEESDAQTAKRKGFVGSIKDMFGIE
jgi:ribose 5-phosphate isomerase RpiB